MIRTSFVLQFPGQGSQVVGMGKALCAASAAAAEVFERADEILGYRISEICFTGPEETLNDTSTTQPALLTTSVAILRALEDELEEAPSFVAGHSLGEFSALVAAGALSFEAALRLVERRGELMKAAGEESPGGMAAVIGLAPSTLAAACRAAQERTGSYVGIANDNCPGQVVISGDEEALEACAELAQAAGARRVIRLAVSIAAHSPLMADAATAFRQALDEAPLKHPAIPVVANATARPLEDPEALRHALAQQLTSPVRWSESVRWMIDQGATRFIEVGPRDILTGLLRRIDRSVDRLTAEQALGREI